VTAHAREQHIVTELLGFDGVEAWLTFREGRQSETAQDGNRTLVSDVKVRKLLTFQVFMENVTTLKA
jgi:hypothetical protein